MFSIKKILKNTLIASAFGLGATSAMALPGCVGKTWNPLSDLDYTLMGGIKVVGFSLMENPSKLGSPPQHKVSPLCFCKDGLDTGFGLGLTFWLPSYINDVARQPGCLGFLNGINILPGFLSLSSGQEYNFHNEQREGISNQQIHWAYADITSLAGKSLFEKCNAVSGGMAISYLTEPDFVFQNDVYSGIMSPQNAIMAAAALLTQYACGAESAANSLGSWINWGGCAWIGSRYPLSANATSKDSAQVSNMDVTVKYLSRSAMLGTTLRTMGDGATCRPQAAILYDPFQHRYQWSFPAKTATRFNQNVVMWGLNTNNGGLSLKQSDDAVSDDSLAIDASSEQASSSQLGGFQGILDMIPRPLNYPTREVGYMQVWEARQCCLMVFTISNAIQMIIENMLTSGNAMLADLYKKFNQVSMIYQVVTDPIGAALGFIGQGIAMGLGKLGEMSGLTGTLKDITTGITDSIGNLAGGAGGA